MANLVGQPPELEVPTRDSDGLMVPPWIRFPDLPATPVGWWRGDQSYRADFREWWDRQTPETRLRVQERYPEPPSWEYFYLVVAQKRPDLDRETRTVYELIAALRSDAFWRRAREEPGFSVLDHMLRTAEAYRAESQEEIAIWDELTSPQHYRALVRYARQRAGQWQVNDDYQLFLGVLQEAARRRWQEAGGQQE
jgi:hypothetical protein